MAFNIGSVSGAATNAVNTVKTAFSEGGPASGLSAISSTIGNTLDAITGAVSGLLGSSGKSIESVKIPFPMPNQLHNYATYNYVFSLGVLSDQEVNFPDSTYKAGKVPKLILKSGNANPDNRISTQYGKFDFFIDSMSINSQIGADKSTGNTNATTFDFTVIEPYSMGLFMMSCQQAAFDAGYKNFREAAFILIIEFRGNLQNGVPTKIPGLTKHIPFRFTNISMKVTGKGSTYNVSALPYNEQAFSKQVANLKSDATIAGKTVQEMLQTGEKSLQAVINSRYQQMEKDIKGYVADQVLILFPIDMASNAAAAAGGTPDKENNTPATKSSTSTEAGSDLFKKLGVSISAKHNTLVQGDGQCNVIGKAGMGVGLTRKASTPMSKGDKVYNAKTGVEVRGNMAVDPTITDMKFSQDSNIQNAINQVIMNSLFVEATLDPANITPEGYRGWWTIQTQVYILGSKENPNTGQKPKLHVYRVIPYGVHASRLMPPNAPAPGFSNLARQAVKHYNYIYTGKNQDIINFNIDIANGFQAMMMADNGNRTADERTAKKDGKGVDPASNIESKPGNTPPKPTEGIAQQSSYAATKTSSDGKGGGPAETNSTRVARLFHDAMINGKDLVNLDLEIVGDPYYLATSGMGNYTAKETDKSNLNADGEVNYQNGEVDIIVNFRTPIDINQATGMYNFGASVAVQQFSGLYKLTTLVSTFSKGQFKQKLSGFRRQGQDDYRNAAVAQVPSAKPTAKAPETDYGDVGVKMPTDDEIKANNAALGDFPG